MAEVEYTSWFSRLGKSIGSVIIGLILFVVAFPVLILNEGNAVHTASSLTEGAASCISPSLDKVDAANEGKLIYVAGEATASGTLTDRQFAVSAEALKLTRTVEIYQWVEREESKTEKQVGGGTKTIHYYYHDAKWVPEPISSAKFHKSDSPGAIKETKPQNRGVKPFDNTEYVAEEVKLGAYQLTKAQVNKIPSQNLPVTQEMLAKVSADVTGKDKLIVRDGAFYLPFQSGESTTQPQIGDVRITFAETKPQKVSVIAKQVNNSFAPWPPPSGVPIDLFDPGIKTKEAMFKEAQDANTTFTWVLRLVGFLLMAIGIYLFFSPLIVFADFLPFMGDFFSGGVVLFAIITALPLTLITIALGWVAYRPLVGIPLLVVGVGILVGGFVMTRRGAASKSAR